MGSGWRSHGVRDYIEGGSYEIMGLMGRRNEV